MNSKRASRGPLLGVSAILFIASAWLTTRWCGSMAENGGMPMPGGWTMSMAWMRMPGQSWPGAAVSFVAMWTLMMVAMMLPSLVPMLWRYRPSRLTALVGVGYFFVWTLFGVAVFPVGVALATLAMQSPALARAVPTAAGVAVLLSGALQFTAWKAHHLSCCRKWPAPVDLSLANVHEAWHHGLRLGLHCSYSTLGLTAILLVMGVMDLRVMAVVTAAVTAERLAPARVRLPQGIGVIVVGSGLFLLGQAAGIA
jgi:predicted metal-binding membrane protein